MREKRDVLFLCQFYHPEYITSAQLPYDTVVALQEAGFSVDVLCGYPREYFDGTDIPVRENLDGVNIRRLKYVQTGRAGFLGRLINYFSFTFMVFLQLFRMGRYRSVVVYSNPPILPWIASWAKCLFGTKLVFVAYDLYPEVATVTNTLSPGNPICRLMNHINMCVYRRADRVISLSSEMQEYIAANRTVAADKLRVIPNWYADRGPAPEKTEANRFRQLVGDRFVVSYFGNMGTMQDMDTLLGAIRMLRDEGVFFLFAGHGNKMEKMKEIAAAEDLTHVAIYDFLHGDAFRDALDISDCAVITLERGATGLCAPSKTYSYMMQGLPLLAVMDPSDIVRDIEQGAGRWVRNGESEALAAIIRELRDNPATVAEMGKTCRAIYLEKYTTPVCTQQYVDLFRELL